MPHVVPGDLAYCAKFDLWMADIISKVQQWLKDTEYSLHTMTGRPSEVERAQKRNEDIATIGMDRKPFRIFSISEWREKNGRETTSEQIKARTMGL